MARLELRRLERLVGRFERLRMLVVGDVMLDEYLWGDVDRVSPEAPVPVVHVTRESQALGGAGNVVRNLVAMGASCAAWAVVGDDRAGDRVVDLFKDLGVDPSGVVRAAGRPTTRKTRVEARAQQMIRFDREDDAPLSARVRRTLLAAMEELLPGVDGAILQDYGKGVLVPALARPAIRRLRAQGVPVAVDPKDVAAPFKGCTLFKPNLREVELLTGIRVRDERDLVRAVAKLRRKLPEADLVVTRGADGMAIFEKGQESVSVPIARNEVFDVQGAGDTSIAALTLARLAGGSLVESVVVANAAAGVVVAKVGTATASPDEIRTLLPEALAAARDNARSSRRKGRA